MRVEDARAAARKAVEAPTGRQVVAALAEGLPRAEAKNLDWFWCYGADYPQIEFADWVHLNENGGRRYASNLMKAVRRGRMHRASCGARLVR